MRWKQITPYLWEAKDKDRKQDFVIDSRKGMVIGIVFALEIKDADKAYIESFEYSSVEEAKKDLGKYREG